VVDERLDVAAAIVSIFTVNPQLDLRSSSSLTKEHLQQEFTQKSSLAKLTHMPVLPVYEKTKAHHKIWGESP
jgi:hypothetical protein